MDHDSDGIKKRVKEIVCLVWREKGDGKRKREAREKNCLSFFGTFPSLSFQSSSVSSLKGYQQLAWQE